MVSLMEKECVYAADVDSIFDDLGLEPGPAKTATRYYCVNLLKTGSYRWDGMETIATSFFDGYLAK